MLDQKNLVQLAIAAANAKNDNPVAYSFNNKNYSASDLNEALRAEFNEIAGTNALYRENKNLVFSIIEQVIDDVLPIRVEEAYKDFAEVKTFAQGDRPLFRRKISARNRAKQFITRVGLAGVYEVFKLGGQESFEVPTSAIGGAAQIGFEDFLDGRADFAEVIDIIMTGMDELVYKEVAEAMIAGVNQLPAANKVTNTGFDEAKFDRLLTIASAYGTPTIYCFNEFAVKMIPKEAWRYTEAMKGELWANGRLANYKNYKVIVMPQGLEDETNTYKRFNPSYCWIIPGGADNKPIKIAFEGATHTREVENADWSRDIQVYRKVGVLAMMNNAICSYHDADLEGTMIAGELLLILLQPLMLLLK